MSSLRTGTDRLFGGPQNAELLKFNRDMASQESRNRRCQLLIQSNGQPSHKRPDDQDYSPNGIMPLPMPHQRLSRPLLLSLPTSVLIECVR